MKKFFKSLGRIGKDVCISIVQAAYVSLRPFRTNRRLRHLESQFVEINRNSEELQEEIVSLSRKVKFLKRDLKESHGETNKSKKDVGALRRWIATVHRLEVPRRPGAIDQLIAKRNEIQEPEENQPAG